MEPVSAVSVAAAALQFLDFGSRLLSTSYQVYKSPKGKTEKQVALSTIIDDLSCLLQHVERVTAGAKPCSATQSKLVHLSDECRNLITPLNKALDRLQGQQNGESSFTFDDGQQGGEAATSKKPMIKILRNALIAVWDESEIEETMGKLEDMRRRMTSAAIFTVWYVSYLASCRTHGSSVLIRS
jgi:hypothetical protein